MTTAMWFEMQVRACEDLLEITQWTTLNEETVGILTGIDLNMSLPQFWSVNDLFY